MRTKQELIEIIEGKTENEVVKSLGFKKEFENEFGLKFEYTWLEEAMKEVAKERLVDFVKRKLNRIPNDDYMAIVSNLEFERDNGKKRKAKE